MPSRPLRGEKMPRLKDRKRKAQPRLTMDDARQLLKCAVVILRDNTPMNYMEASLAFAYCWQHTESVEESDERSKNGD